MKKSAIILAGALAFDLGILVVGGHAAESPTTTQTLPGKQVDYFLKVDGIKGESTDSKHKDEITLLACTQKFGKVIDTPQGKVCRVPKAPGAK